MFAFEKFIAYQKAEFVYIAIQKFLKSKKYFNVRIKDQLDRSSLSIIANISEGFGKTSPKDKSNFYKIARGSLNETVTIMRTLFLREEISKEKYEEIYDQAGQVGKILSTIINKLES